MRETVPQEEQPQSEYDPLGLFRIVAPERSDELAHLNNDYSPAFVVAAEGAQFLFQASPSFGLVRYSNRTLLRVWLLAWVLWKEMYCWATEVWALARTGTPFVLQRLEALPGQTDSYMNADSLYAEVLEFVSADSLNWGKWPARIPKPLEIAAASKEHWFIKDLAHHAIAFFLLHELRHLTLQAEGLVYAAQAEEEMECDRWAIDFLITRSDTHAFAGEQPMMVRSKRAMGLALGMAVIAHVQKLGLWEPGRDHPSAAGRMKALADFIDLPDSDFFWTVASSFVLASRRRGNALPTRIELTGQRDLLTKLLDPPA